MNPSVCLPALCPFPFRGYRLRSCAGEALPSSLCFFLASPRVAPDTPKRSPDYPYYYPGNAGFPNTIVGHPSHPLRLRSYIWIHSRYNPQVCIAPFPVLCQTAWQSGISSCCPSPAKWLVRSYHSLNLLASAKVMGNFLEVFHYQC